MIWNENKTNWETNEMKATSKEKRKYRNKEKQT